MTEVPQAIKDQFAKEYASLALRVRDGNEKLIAAWLMIQDLADPQSYSISMNRLAAACDKLARLALKLEVIQEVFEGEGQCLYFEKGKKTRRCKNFEKTPKGQSLETWCWICPSHYPHWKEEWSEFNSALLQPK
jgi:hypothetical protein